MGKSDPIVFQIYREVLNYHDLKKVRSVAFLGFSGENSFTQSVSGNIRDFYDKSIGNWNINDDWNLGKSYDLIICTRCAYFSKDPDLFIEKIKMHLSTDGCALVDWGLGDHWRFKKYKIGWVKDQEHEYAYGEDNFLYSCMWNDFIMNHEETKNFWSAVCQGNFGYSLNQDLTQIVKKEIISLVDYKTKNLTVRFLWPESPQLYIVTLFGK